MCERKQHKMYLPYVEDGILGIGYPFVFQAFTCFKKRLLFPPNQVINVHIYIYIVFTYPVYAVIGFRHVEMKPAGRGMIGCCPFHDDKTPSFSVDESRGSYHCFGCSARGDVIAFSMQVCVCVCMCVADGYASSSRLSAQGRVYVTSLLMSSINYHGV